MLLTIEGTESKAPRTFYNVKQCTNDLTNL